MTIKKHTTYEYDGFEFDIEPYEDSIQVKETKTGFTVGYLAHDDIPGVWNDGDGIGDIYLGSHRYSTYKKYLETLGYNSYKEKDYDFEIDPDVVMLSVYEHGGMVLSIMGEGTQCRWDTVNGGAVWVPDKVLLEDAEGLDAKERREQMVKFASQALEIYNAYNNCDVWGIIIREYDSDKCFDEEVESCWGFVGYKYALEELRSEMLIDESESRLELA